MVCPSGIKRKIAIKPDAFPGIEITFISEKKSKTWLFWSLGSVLKMFSYQNVENQNRCVEAGALNWHEGRETSNWEGSIGFQGAVSENEFKPGPAARAQIKLQTHISPAEEVWKPGLSSGKSDVIPFQQQISQTALWFFVIPNNINFLPMVKLKYFEI